ncbi:long-chain-acyl-CoA synthetase [Brevundimonas sp. 2R-24]|uniref:Long-chain-acyl-CoA synthetase n=1 Tax=Peiella sedimenti TaxID=3061083 RepID=A0ABT8SHE6_9CAUL|nr:long-chain-acyl-CoA synthetase [Caulobacteraceae bacterium XZ-24]
MKMSTRIGRETAFIKGISRLFRRIRPIRPDGTDLVCDDWEEAVDRWPENVAVIGEDRQVTYRELDLMANRFGHWAKGRGLRKGDVIALMIPNRIEYLAAWIGFSKVGVVTALVNTNLTGQALAHCLKIVGARHLICDFETFEAGEEAKGRITDRTISLWVLGLRAEDETSERRGLDTPVKGASAVRPDRSQRAGMTNKDLALYIYTSGTTGLPKAARITHQRARLYMRAFAGATDANQTDRIYCVLPLYHSTGGLCGVGAALLNGGAVVLRRRFSASQFWTDVAEKGCTMFVYIGELCRYLLNSPPHPLERQHRLRFAFGNGLRPEVWPAFQERFAIPRIMEFYGSTEGNASLFNFDGKPGAIGRIPWYLKSRINVRLVRMDEAHAEPLRGADGLCREAAPGEIGEAIGRIGEGAKFEFGGYADRAASEKKVLEDVFKKGDRWFRTGDLMRMDRDGYFYFVDRMGDTFRWKGENVSTTEVAERLSGAPGVQEVIAYGVPVEGAEGKAGMVALRIDGKFDPAAFGEHADRELPPYARPAFVRLLRNAPDTTGTFKYRKVDLEREGWSEDVTDPLYVRSGDKYAKLTPAARRKLAEGALRL